MVVDELEKKKRFAVEHLKTPQEAFRIASSLFGDDVGRALDVATRWPSDPDVLRFKEEAVQEVGDLHFLPTKADAARLAWDLANTNNLLVEDRLKALRLYSDIRGFIEKQGTTINNNVLNSNKVMLVTDHGDTSDWEAKLAQQQQTLIENATIRH
jgi:hypothetical protein